MTVVRVRRIDGGTFVEIPPALAANLERDQTTTLDITLEGDRLVLAPRQSRRPTLGELLAACEIPGDAGDHDDWTSAGAQGRELL